MPTNDTFQTDGSLPKQPDWRAVAVYCSDGRFAPACEQFLNARFADQCVDRFVLPGGPGALIHNHDRDGRLEELRFLVKAHGLSEIVLIMHEQCGFYEHALGMAATAMAAQQQRDLDDAQTLLRQHIPHVLIESYRAVQSERGITIEPGIAPT
jgi:carbonic anhydrase